ncbi:DUF1295 domain-containing protein [Streptomyces sp. C10]|uniref:DUF1295 domain-containing protein n=1 Tax=Streptomyces sp. C10 TaxID=531941 RepID=UPI00398178D3
MTVERRRIAVVGGGVAELTAAYVLQQGGCAVSLYEAEDRLGGHAYTHDRASEDGRVIRVDTGFIVHNERTYPLLLRLFRELGVATQDSEMSMSVRCEGCGLEYAGARGPAGLFAQPRSALRGRYLRMLTEIRAFHRAARTTLATDRGDTLTLGRFLTRCGFSRYFVTHFVTPLVSAVWSCAPTTAMQYPAVYLFRFLDHHGLLSAGGSPRWKTVTGGSVEYVSRVGKQLTTVHTGTPVRAVHRAPDRARIVTEDGTERTYDAVVVAVFKADPAHRGRVMDRGLWGWTRHPNYFGDFLVWWGLFLLACGTAQSAALAVVSPLVMSLLLTYGSGKRLLENHLADRPGYAAYRARTSGFVPLPPRRRPHTEVPRP